MFFMLSNCKNLTKQDDQIKSYIANLLYGPGHRTGPPIIISRIGPPIISRIEMYKKLRELYEDI